MDRIHIHLDTGDKCWFTSDQHFCHINIMIFCHRPWDDINEMNRGITDNWNEVVGNNDVVFILGDFHWLKDPVTITKKIKELKGGVIYILPGNHDSVDVLNKIKDKRVRVISDTAVVFLSGLDYDKPFKEYEFMISHFPLATWPHFRNGVINLDGHIHSGPRVKNEVDVPGVDLFLNPNLTYDVGVDNNEYYPVEIRDILNKLGKI